MARTGRPRQDVLQAPIEHLEAFCCLQVVRIQQKLANRYGKDYDGRVISDAQVPKVLAYHKVKLDEDIAQGLHEPLWGRVPK